MKYKIIKVSPWFANEFVIKVYASPFPPKIVMSLILQLHCTLSQNQTFQNGTKTLRKICNVEIKELTEIRFLISSLLSMTFIFVSEIIPCITQGRLMTYFGGSFT